MLSAGVCKEPDRGGIPNRGPGNNPLRNSSLPNRGRPSARAERELPPNGEFSSVSFGDPANWSYPVPFGTSVECAPQYGRRAAFSMLFSYLPSSASALPAAGLLPFPFPNAKKARGAQISQHSQDKAQHQRPYTGLFQPLSLGTEHKAQPAYSGHGTYF